MRSLARLLAAARRPCDGLGAGTARVEEHYCNVRAAAMISSAEGNLPIPAGPSIAHSI
jgi:hypothetical protein